LACVWPWILVFIRISVIGHCLTARSALRILDMAANYLERARVLNDASGRFGPES